MSVSDVSQLMSSLLSEPNFCKLAHLVFPISSFYWGQDTVICTNPFLIHDIYSKQDLLKNDTEYEPVSMNENVLIQGMEKILGLSLNNDKPLREIQVYINHSKS